MTTQKSSDLTLFTHRTPRVSPRAIVGALIFGLGFGHVLQLVHSRAWHLPLPERYSDQARYAVVHFFVAHATLPRVTSLITPTVATGPFGLERRV